MKAVRVNWRITKFDKLSDFSGDGAGERESGSFDVGLVGKQNDTIFMDISDVNICNRGHIFIVIDDESMVNTQNINQLIFLYVDA